MHTLVIENTTGRILQSRYDSSTGPKMPIAQVLETYCKDTGTSLATVGIVEIQFQQFELTIGKHIYQDGQILVSPTWVEPPVVVKSLNSSEDQI